MNRLHESVIRIAYSDFVSIFEELLTEDGTCNIHQRNWKVSSLEMYKITHKKIKMP